MGYTTEFEGVLKFACPMPQEGLAYLNSMLGINPDDHPEFNKGGRQLSYIQFQITKDFSGIEWDGNEKFYYAVNACNFIIENMQLKFPGFGLTGELLAQGEEIGDVWKLVIGDDERAHQVKIDVKGLIQCPECDHKFKIDEAA